MFDFTKIIHATVPPRSTLTVRGLIIKLTVNDKDLQNKCSAVFYSDLFDEGKPTEIVKGLVDKGAKSENAIRVKWSLAKRAFIS